jgi:hypothetical protein
MLLFFWPLDTAIVNSYLLYRTVWNYLSKTQEQATASRSSGKGHMGHMLTYREFRERLYQELLQAGITASGSKVGRETAAASSPTGVPVSECSPGPSPTIRRTTYTKTLPDIRFLPAPHPEVKASRKPFRGYCVYCCWIRAQERKANRVQQGVFGTVLQNGRTLRSYWENTIPGGAGNRPAQTRVMCSTYSGFCVHTNVSHFFILAIVHRCSISSICDFIRKVYY